MKKYELTENKKHYLGIELSQIKALTDFGCVKEGDLGGYIEKEDNLSHYGDSWVCGDAIIFGNAEVSGNAKVFGNAVTSGKAEVSGNAKVFGKAEVSGNAEVSGKAEVSGNAEVSGDARVCGNYKYTKGKFIGGDYSEKITRIEDKMGTEYWKAQYVLGDYEIEPIEEEKKKVTLELTDEQLEKIREIIKN